LPTVSDVLVLFSLELVESRDLPTKRLLDEQAWVLLWVRMFGLAFHSTFGLWRGLAEFSLQVPDRHMGLNFIACWGSCKFSMLIRLLSREGCT
jgi:hypothetical protein